MLFQLSSISKSKSSFGHENEIKSQRKKENRKSDGSIGFNPFPSSLGANEPRALAQVHSLSLYLEWAGQIESHTEIRPTSLDQSPITFMPPLGPKWPNGHKILTIQLVVLVTKLYYLLASQTRFSCSNYIRCDIFFHVVRTWKSNLSNPKKF